MTGEVCFLYYDVFSSVLCFQRTSTPCGGLHLQTRHPRLKDGKLKVTPVCGAKFETACPPSLHKTVSKEREGGRGQRKGGEGRRREEPANATEFQASTTENLERERGKRKVKI